MTQKEKVLRHLQTYGSITPLEAWSEYGIMRLGARIKDLEADGIPINHGRERAVNRFGEPVVFAKYEIQKQENTITDWRASLKV